MEIVINLIKNYVPWAVPVIMVLISKKAQKALGVTLSGILRGKWGRVAVEWVAKAIKYLADILKTIANAMLAENVREEVVKEIKKKEKKKIKKKVEKKIAEENPTE